MFYSYLVQPIMDEARETFRETPMTPFEVAEFVINNDPTLWRDHVMKIALEHHKAAQLLGLEEEAAKLAEYIERRKANFHYST